MGGREAGMGLSHPAQRLQDASALSSGLLCLAQVLDGADVDHAQRLARSANFSSVAENSSPSTPNRRSSS